MLITQFPCQTELFPECLKGQKNWGNWEGKKEEKRDNEIGER